MLTTSRVIVTEGRYDKAKLSDIIDADIFVTDGFAVYKDKAMQKLLRELAARRGLLILTDPDRAGFRIRAFIKGLCPPGTCLDAYIPDVYGKESRKSKPAAEGKLGVEGIDARILRRAITESGAADERPDVPERVRITVCDLYDAGLTGSDGASLRRAELLKKLELPERLGTKQLLSVLNCLYSREEFIRLTEGTGNV
ncbi:MAG: DUF4093 domain-containing protein [Clostridia bacterium]|nr:DUF4093 domain-containing protein [Clostridia bacterium]